MNTNENSESKNSLLDSIEKKDLSGGYAVPENYFEMLSRQIEDRVKKVPNLVSVQKENVFEVPDNYFAGLENAIREKISSQTAGNVISIEQWYKRPKLVLAYAAVLVFSIIASTYLFTSNIHQTINDKDISFNDIYTSDYVSELDESSLVALLEESFVPQQNETQVYDYMIDNNIDVSTLTDEL